MSRWDSMGLFWVDLPTSRKRSERVLGPLPPWEDSGWKPVPLAELPDIRGARCIALDTETKDLELGDNGPGWGRDRGKIIGASIAWEGGQLYLPWGHEVEAELNYPEENIKRYLNHILGGSGDKIGANLIYDMGWLKWEGVTVNGDLYDVQIAEALINETSKLGLDELGHKYVGEGKDADYLMQWILDYYMPPKTRWRRELYRSPTSWVGPYAEQDAALPLQVMRKQLPQLQQRGLMDLFRMECDLIRLFVDMRLQGVQIDVPYAEQLHERFVKDAEDIQKQVNHIAGMEVNTNAAQSMADAFDTLGLAYGRTEPTESKPEGSPSFTKPFMETVDHDFARKVLQLKQLLKLDSTFVQSYLLNSHVNGKVYCSFHPVSSVEGGARTGRLSSSNPNLQNIPVRSEEGKLIRAAFIHDFEHKQVRDYDYSQVEYRLLAHFAVGPGSDEVRQKYRDDPTLDYHKMTGQIITNVTGQELARGYIKNVNFGIIYGLGNEALASQLGVSPKESKKITKIYHEAIKFAGPTMEETMKEVNRRGIIDTILGRQSHFDLWEHADWDKRKGPPLPYQQAKQRYGTNLIRAYAYRGLNYRLQGSAADIMKKAMHKNYVDGVFDVTGVPRLTVHDELFFSDPGNVPEDAWKEMQHNAETCVPLKVPLIFECDMGANWAEAH